MTDTSFQRDMPSPSVVISDGFVTVPLWAVSSLTVTETQDTVANNTSLVTMPRSTLSLAGVLLGPDRFASKLALEAMAALGGSADAVANATEGFAAFQRSVGLIVMSSVAVSTEMHITDLSFSVSATRRDVIDVTVSLVRMPIPADLGALLGAASFAVGALRLWEGG